MSLICRDYFAEQSSINPNFTYIPVIFGEDNAQCQVIPEVQRRVTRFQLYFTLISAILSAVITPKLGDWSDQYGRIRVLALSSFGFLISEIFTVVVAARPESAPLYLLLIGAIFDGLAGSISACTALVHAYATDCSPPERRNVIFGYFHGVLFTGIAIGPYLFGLVVERTGNVLIVFYASLACHALFSSMLVFVIPESVSRKRQLSARKKNRSAVQKEGRVVPWYHINPTNLLRPLAILYPTVENPDIPDAKRRSITRKVRRNLLLLASIDFLMFGVAMGTMQILVIYGEYMYQWSSYESGVFLSLVNSTRVVALLVFLPALTRVFRGPQSQSQTNLGADTLDLMVIRLSIIFDILGYCGYIVARASAVMTFSGMVTSLGGMGPPSLQSALTKHIPPSRTGQILGAGGLYHAFARVAGPLIFFPIYERTVGQFSQAVFVCLASFFGLAFILSWFVQPHGESVLRPCHTFHVLQNRNTRANRSEPYSIPSSGI
jgi:MFS-type transporter involved in bile tolerance (Atg22 family)